MELHTLGVDGGYSQGCDGSGALLYRVVYRKAKARRDVQVDERLHDPDPKVVLGKKIHAGGMRDGEEVIGLLARHPSTAKFISTKLARRLFPTIPAGIGSGHGAELSVERRRYPRGDEDDDLFTGILVARCVPREGNNAVELVVSTARALGTDVDSPMPLVQ